MQQLYYSELTTFGYVFIQQKHWCDNERFPWTFFVMIQEALWTPTSEINRELKRDYDSESKRANIFLPDAGWLLSILC